MVIIGVVYVSCEWQLVSIIELEVKWNSCDQAVMIWYKTKRRAIVQSILHLSSNKMPKEIRNNKGSKIKELISGLAGMVLLSKACMDSIVHISVEYRRLIFWNLFFQLNCIYMLALFHVV